jgi:transketolase
VKVVGTGAGMVYSALGPTHHSTEDMGCLRSLPNLTIFSPATPLEVKYVTKAAYEMKGPVYIRLGTNKEEEIYEQDYDFQIGKGVTVREGSDVTILSTGNIIVDVLKAREILEKENISVRVINIHTIKPIDKEMIKKAAIETGRILTVEDHNIIGGLGSAVAEVIAESGIGTAFIRMGLNESFSKGYGSYTEVKDMNHIGINDICNNIRNLVAGGN